MKVIRFLTAARFNHIEAFGLVAMSRLWADHLFAYAIIAILAFGLVSRVLKLIAEPSE